MHGFALLHLSLALVSADVTHHAASGLELATSRTEPVAVSASTHLPPAITWDLEEEPQRRLVADWEARDATLLVYTNSWAQSLANAVEVLSAYGPVYVAREDFVPDASAREWHRGLTREAQANVHLMNLSLDSPWVRDFGPLQVEEADQRVVWLDTRYISSRPADDAAPRWLAQYFNAPIRKVRHRLDGGSIISNGLGFCAATYEYFEENDLLPLENDASVQTLMRDVGCTSLTLVPALRNENTRHVDMTVQFAASNRMVVADLDPAMDPEDFMRLELTTMLLMQAAAERGLELEVHRVPIGRIKNEIYYSYSNVFPLADVLLVPSYRDVPAGIEAQAFDSLRSAYPDRELIAIDAGDMIQLEGALHCTTLGVADRRRRRSPELGEN